MSRSIWIVIFAAACGTKTSPPPASEPAPPPAPPPLATGSTTPPDPDIGAVCGTRGAATCPAGTFCSFAAGANCGETDKPGHCMKRPELCPEIFQPVCGCNGKTYPNACHAAAAQTGVREATECK